MEQKFRLNEFKELFNALKTGVTWVDHLLLAFFYFLEGKIIDSRVKNEVDKAVETVELPPLPDLVSPVYRESPSETPESLPEMRLTAPWYIDSQKELKGR